MKNKCIVLVGPEELELRDVELKPLKPDEIRVKNEYSCISAGTERANIVDMPNTVHKFNRAFGYNSVGIIIDKGEEVKDFKIGERVLCFFAGGHRLYTTGKAKNFCKVPDGVDPKDAAFVIVGGFGLEGARMTRCEIGESAMVVGCGLLGLFALQSFRNMGAVPLVAIDFNEDRLRIARELGADYTFRPDEENLKEKVLEITDGRGINAAVEVTGSAKALVTTLELMARHGRVALTGCTRISDEPIDFYQLVHRPGIQLLGGHTSARPATDSYPGYWTAHDDHRTLLNLIKTGRMKVAPMRSECVNPEDVSAVYERLVKMKNPPLGVLFDWSLVKED